MFRKISIILLLIALWRVVGGAWLAAYAQQDSIRVSVLTCSPGQEVYSLYGHTAIRVQVPKDSIDEVFNYGVFDFRKPHFTWHFVLGQTDYMVEPLPWRYFIIDYERRGSSITEQELNLTAPEASCLFSALVENCRPENREYRYSFLYNNCTTKVRDMVEQTIVGSIQYPDTLPHMTAREVLHRYTAQHPWAQEGNDLLLGSEVDTIMSERAAMFIPENMMMAFDDAFILNAKGDMRPLVRSKKVLLEAKQQAAEPEFPLLPWQVITLFAAICLLVMMIEIWAKRLFWPWDVLILLLQGIAGTLLTFMFLFSEHPAVDSNWQVWILSPIYFIGIPLVIKAAKKHQQTLWYAFYFVVLALFLLFSPWIPQVFAKITVPLALCLLTRPISYYYYCRRKKKHGRK
ncbi:MAG: DUF4105 domain-containing protein [Bacteroidaceae bacterium]|nr:DUF4105 domain-containing protein [Bacteroidaceae bacterium]